MRKIWKICDEARRKSIANLKVGLDGTVEARKTFATLAASLRAGSRSGKLLGGGTDCGGGGNQCIAIKDF